MAGRIAVLVLLMVSLYGLAAGQGSRAPLTDSDVIRMVKAGISERTILLEIKEGPTRFDTSARALIRLKKSGVREEIIDAMLLAAQPKSAPPPPPLPAKPLTGEEMIAKALNAIGPQDKLIAIHSIRWTGSATQSTPEGETSFEEEGLRVFPGLAYVALQRPSLSQKVVVTPEFGYRSSGDMTIAIPSPRADFYRQEMRFDPVDIAQHLSDYVFTPLGSEQLNGVNVDVLKISEGGMEYVWRIDARTGRLLSAKYQLPSGEVKVEYSDYRAVDGLYFPFKKRTVTSDRTTDLMVDGYTVNPTPDGSLFLRPSSLSPTALRLKVLQSESISYTQELGGGNSANCQLSESANSSVIGDSLDDIGFSNGQPGANIQMICNSWDKNSIMPRILNAILVVSSDGNAYVIACDKAWRWSKCAPLQAGLIFHGSRSENKIDVRGVNAEGKEQEARYTILLTKPLQ